MATLAGRAVDSMLEELKCAVCLETLEEPMALECQHQFCAGCIADAVRRLPACPICKADVARRSVKPDEFLAGLVSTVKLVRLALPCGVSPRAGRQPLRDRAAANETPIDALEVVYTPDVQAMVDLHAAIMKCGDRIEAAHGHLAQLVPPAQAPAPSLAPDAPTREGAPAAAPATEVAAPPPAKPPSPEPAAEPAPKPAAQSTTEPSAEPSADTSTEPAAEPDPAPASKAAPTPARPPPTPTAPSSSRPALRSSARGKAKRAADEAAEPPADVGPRERRRARTSAPEPAAALPAASTPAPVARTQDSAPAPSPSAGAPSASAMNSAEPADADERCAVCLEGDSFDDNQILFCDNCDLAVHQVAA